MTFAFRRVTTLAALALLLSLVPAALKAAHAAGGRGAGLLEPYTFSNCSKAKPTDPINVIWYQTAAIPGTVALQLKRMGWSHNDYVSPLASLFHAVDYQYVKQIGGCYRDDRQAATGNPISTRFHVRLFSTANSRGTVYVAGDAHHDRIIVGHGCKKALGHAGHISDTFDVAREQIVEYWPDSRPKFRNWQNTRWMRQCNGSYTAGDGSVVYLKTNIATVARRSYHPDNVERPVISGIPSEGQTLTVTSGSWSDPAASLFVYQWCKVDIDRDRCINIDGATGSSWTVPPGSIGSVYAVKVRPSGASTTDAALAVPVTIEAAKGDPPSVTVLGGGPAVTPDLMVTTGGLDTTVTWIARCGPLDADGHPSDECPHGVTTINGSVTGTVLSDFGEQDACNNVDYWVQASNAAGTVWTNEIINVSYCS